MTVGLNGVVSVIFATLTLISVVASAVAVAKASLAKSTIETLQDSNAALTERVGLLEEEDARQKDRLLTCESENKVLRTVASGTVAIEHLGVQLAAQYGHILTAVEGLTR